MLKGIRYVWLISCLFFLSNGLVAQESDKEPEVETPEQPVFKDYQWKEKPSLHTLSDAEKAEPEVVILDKRGIEFFYDENNLLHEYSLKHKIIRVNSDEAIKYNNRIYIPFSTDVKLVREKARVINSEGKVRELVDTDIKEAKDEETNQTYRYFAVEGVDVGSEIEYYYLVDKYPSYTGSLIALQGEETIKKASVEIISPANLVFTARSFNGLPEMTKDSTLGELNYLRLEVDSIPKLKQEESAVYTPHLKQLIYKLDKDYYSGRKDVVSYDEAAKAVYQSNYGPLSKKAEKAIEKLIKSGHFASISDMEEQVRAVENYVKSKFNVLEYSADQLSDMETVLETNICNEAGITKLLATIYTKLKIPHRIVLTSDRNTLRFDKNFQAYNYLQNYVIYFPKLDKYMAPAVTFMRLGFIPPGWTNNYALFLEPFTMGDYQTALPQVKFIKTPSYKESLDNLNVDVKFGKDFSKLDISIKRESAGYYAQNTQPYYDFLNEEQKKEVTEAVIKNISPDAEIKSASVENEGSNNFAVKPFIVNAEITTASFMEKAGPKYIFKVGELIGPQIEMYQEEERKLEVENDFTRMYHRVITFDIPDGYEIRNLDDLTMDVNSISEEDTIMTFNSHYTLEGNKVSVTIIEYYKKVVYPLELFEEYRKVINAAADFNKVSLILEKKG